MFLGTISNRTVKDVEEEEVISVDSNFTIEGIKKIEEIVIENAVIADV